MILGIGTDMAKIDRIAEILLAHDMRFVNRCFAEEERLRIETRKKTAPHRAAGYAKYWAAKEACAKALGTGIRDNIYLRDIIVVQNDDGKPEMILRGGAKKKLDAMTPDGMTPRIHISLSDEAGSALAFVVISAEKI